LEFASLTPTYELFHLESGAIILIALQRIGTVLEEFGSHAMWVRFDNFSKVVKSVATVIISPTLHHYQEFYYISHVTPSKRIGQGLRSSIVRTVFMEK
jgi:hypothetical protein